MKDLKLISSFSGFCSFGVLWHCIPHHLGPLPSPAPKAASPLGGPIRLWWQSWGSTQVFAFRKWNYSPATADSITIRKLSGFLWPPLSWLPSFEENQEDLWGVPHNPVTFALTQGGGHPFMHAYRMHSLQDSPLRRKAPANGCPSLTVPVSCDSVPRL